MEGMKAAKVEVDRKVIADLAATDTAAFGELVTIAKNALKNRPAATLAKAKTSNLKFTGDQRWLPVLFYDGIFISHR